MSRVLRIAMVISLGSPLILVSSAGAIASSNRMVLSTRTDEALTTTVAEDTTRAADDNPSTDDTKEALTKRLEQRKTDLKIKLTNVEEQRLQTKCKAAQSVVGKLDTRVKTIETNRHGVHAKMTEKLNGLVEKLKAAGIDTATLEGQVSTLQTKITAFESSLGEYQQAIADLSTMDCSQDPTAFKASLEQARTLREALAKSGAEIRAYIKDTIKPTLKDLRAQLAALKAESQPSTEGGN